MMQNILHQKYYGLSRWLWLGS